MNSIARWVSATALVVSALVYPQETVAESFTGKDFLEWTAGEQRSYINAQIVMASSIVARKNPAMSQCVSDAFFGSNGLTDEAFANFQANMRDYSTYHPSSILVVLIENQCGSFY